MFPGRFPSPTPSLSDSESSASELKNEGFRSSLNTKRRRNISFDYTAPSSLRMKPEFAQSGPSLASTSGVHTPSRPTEAPRSASDPLLNRQRSCLQSNGSPIRITKNRHQKRTNGSAREPTTRRASHQRSTSPKDIYTNTRSPNPETPTRSATSSVQQNPERAPPEAKQPSPNPQGSNSPRSPETTRSVQDKLQSKLSKTVKPNTSKGYVYVIRDPKRPELGYKIGSTGGDPTTRLKQYKTKCGFVPQLINDPFEVEYFQHTETLAHADLAYWCRPYACQCGTLHHEWFAVSEEVAVQTAERWVGFMRRERPYDYKGRLRCVWSYLLERRRVSCGASEASDHDARWEKWARVLESPSVGDYWHATIDSLSSDLRKIRFKIYTVWTFTTTFLWQLSTFVYALVTIFHFQSVLVLTVSMVLGVCAFCSMLKVHIPISTKRRSQRE